MRVSGKVALVTGAAGGIGAACAALLLREGALVVATDLMPAQPAGLSACRYIRHDVSAADEWQRVVEQVVDLYGRIDVLVHCAGIEGSTDRRGLDTTEEDWSRVMTVNLTGTFLGCRTVLPEMLKRGEGSIILMASANTEMATPQALAYGASKAGMRHLARSMAVIGAKDGAQVRCNTIHPGSIETRMSDNLIAAIAAAAAVPVESVEARFRSQIPLGYRGQPNDVAELVLYLASDQSRYATGSAFTLDGGWSIRTAG